MARPEGPEGSKGLKDGFVIAKTVWTPCNALVREEALVVSPYTTSTRLARATEVAVVVSRVMARIVYWEDNSWSARTWLMMELPWWPFAPKMARILDMANRAKKLCLAGDVLSGWYVFQEM